MSVNEFTICKYVTKTNGSHVRPGKLSKHLLVETHHGISFLWSPGLILDRRANPQNGSRGYDHHKATSR